MIPYFQWTQIHIGPVPIQVWGLMVALGIVAGLVVARWAARQRGVSTEGVMDLAFWAIISALVGARVLYVLSEFPSFVAQPLNALKVWEGGMSITGGFVGAALAGWIYIRQHRLDPWPLVDVMVFGLPVGLWIGRLGCFFIFDHPGTPTTFFLGQQFIDDVVRHNHGLYLSINGLVLSLVFAVLWWRRPQRFVGFYVALFLIWKGVARFVLDFFRAWDAPYADARYAQLTVAQYIALVMVVGGALLWYTLGRRTSRPSS